MTNTKQQKSQRDKQRTASRRHKASRPLEIECYGEPQELQKPRRTMQITDYSSIRSLQQKTQSEEQVSEKAEKYDIRDYYSHASLRNPFIEEESERVHAKFFTKPNQKKPLTDPHQPDFTLEESKKFLRGLAAELNGVSRGPACLREYKAYVPEDLSKPKKSKMPITDNSIKNLPQKNMSKLPHHSKPKSEKAEKYASLRNPLIEEESERVHAQFFTIPSLSQKKPLIDPHQPDFTLEESKEFLRGLAAELNGVSRGPACLRDDEGYEPEDLNKPKKSIQMPITDNSIKNLPQKNMSELPHHSKPKSEKAGGLKIPKKEWENITRPSVMLDPNTANPTLKLSDDGRSVRTKTHEEFHSSQSYYGYQRTSEHQYNGWTCVQAREGYSTGRHYWEVDVKGKCDWRIGVVSEFAPRNGFINLNTDRGYWTLRLQLGSLMAMTVPVTKLNQAAPSKIGVHLDMEGSQVSFYDAMKRTHIYTFQADFSKRGNIYPVFGTRETDKPLRII